jgi:hypothetical protein
MMSWVANMMLVVSEEDLDLMPALNEWLRHDAPWNSPSDPPGATGVGYLALLPKAGWGG